MNDGKWTDRCDTTLSSILETGVQASNQPTCVWWGIQQRSNEVDVVGVEVEGGVLDADGGHVGEALDGGRHLTYELVLILGDARIPGSCMGDGDKFVFITITFD